MEDNDRKEDLAPPTSSASQADASSFDISQIVSPIQEATPISGAAAHFESELTRSLGGLAAGNIPSALRAYNAQSSVADLHDSAARALRNAQLGSPTSMLRDYALNHTVSESIKLASSVLQGLPSFAGQKALAEVSRASVIDSTRFTAGSAIDVSIAASAKALLDRSTVIDGVASVAAWSVRDGMGTVGGKGAYADAAGIASAIHDSFAKLASSQEMAAVHSAAATAASTTSNFGNAIGQAAAVQLQDASLVMTASAAVGLLDKTRLDAFGVVGMIDHKAIIGGKIRSTIDQLSFSVARDSRDSIFGALGAVGSLASLATELSGAGASTGSWAEKLFGDVANQMASAGSTHGLSDMLQRNYTDLYPKTRMPTASEIGAVMASTGPFSAIEAYKDWAARTRTLIEGVQTPWVLADQAEASIEALARLTVLESTVRFEEPAASDMADMLRLRLGDYRQARVPARRIIEDPVSRSAYQLDRGFDPTLSLLPTAVVAAVFAPLGAETPADEVNADQLENMVRMMLKRIELALRAFISQHMRAAFGEGWFEKVPSGPRRSCTQGRQRDIDLGRSPGELIDYADIDHYRAIIENPKNWAEVFEPILGDQVPLRESLRRIAIVRNPNSHFRSVTVEDLITIRAEIIHLGRWMRVGDFH